MRKCFFLAKALFEFADGGVRYEVVGSSVKLKGRAKAALAYVISGGSLTADPVVNVLLHAILGIAIPSLDFAFELLSVAVNLS